MSKISNQQGRNVQKSGVSGYTRAVGNDELGQLLSRVQACVISNGNELEKLLIDRCSTIDNIDIFIKKVTTSNINQGTFLCTKKILKKTQDYKDVIKGIEPDMIIFIVSNYRLCKIIELKDGDTFDTKKVKGEKANLVTFSEKFGAKIPFSTDYYVCCFNQNNKEIIREGMKNEFDLEHIMTGKELCQLLNIDYQEIINIRKNDMEENFNYFIEELLKIPEVLEKINQIIATSENK
ncbi:restriction endonuclease [Campylobacter sp. P255]|uniref:restriction endonuclease n=1 Tax=Campylobacter sp. P255 TaxID=1979368 RepID=UPI000EAA0A34|nr:restriction endonuclease [Campylobacter sp. P255]RKO64671.1 restriction endonuclease [Campylobacter sp. P255]